MNGKFCILVTAGFCPMAMAADAARPSGKAAVAFGDVLQWGAGLAVVLMLFFICVWAVRKINGMSAIGGARLRIVAGLSLGLREKVVVLEVGKKQLLLGVTPGRIETLLVLDEAECLTRDNPHPVSKDSSFAQKLMQVMKGRFDV
ncbi:MAG: flagellar biosynthetic protein FliO [Gammaproteobacteria bacterium HGW-Gammaproteobacteria-3]|nr:MAG: flagellar biosynthetic protein FliO [Gammaproteobacteria bacterium HGW-Gammaproteobacteria-3]